MEDSKVAVSLEDLRTQFRTFGEGLQMVNNKIKRLEQKVDSLDLKFNAHIDQNRLEHQQIM